jgi:protein-tyrosine phosphatase
MARLGIDIKRHRARQITGTMARNADLVLTMEKAQRDMIRRMLVWKTSTVRLLTTFNPQPRHPEIEDPYGRSLQAYQTCILALTPCIEGLVEWLATTIQPSLRKPR